MAIGRIAFKEIEHVFVQRGVFGEGRGEFVQLFLRGKFAFDEQIRCFQKGGSLGKFFDGDPAVAQDAFFSVQERDAARARAGIAEAVVERDIGSFTAQCGNINGFLVFGPGDDGKIVGRAIDRDTGCFLHYFSSSPDAALTGWILALIILCFYRMTSLKRVIRKSGRCIFLLKLADLFFELFVLFAQSVM